jgi:hypothetical protein
MLFHRPHLPAALLTGAISVAAGAHAAEPVIEVTPQTVLEAAKVQGSARLIRSKKGTPIIQGQIAGQRYLVILLKCAEGRSCAMMQFRGQIPADGATVDHINNWNMLIPIGTVSLDGDKVRLTGTFITAYGMPKSTIESHVQAWGEFLQMAPTSLKEARHP